MNELPTTELQAIACYPTNGNQYALVLVDDNGTHAHTLSENKLKTIFAVIGEALQPGLIASLSLP